MAGEGEIRSSWPTASRLAHELNNDLGIITAECDLLELTLNDKPSDLARLQAIKDAVRRIVAKIQASESGSIGLRDRSAKSTDYPPD